MTSDSYFLSPIEEHFKMSDEDDEEINIYEAFIIVWGQARWFI